MKFQLIVSVFFILFYLTDICSGWLPLKSDVPMGHGQVEFRITRKDKPLPTGSAGYRLSKAIAPIHYDLEIRPIIEPDDIEAQFMAPGTVTIKIKCLQNSSTVTLHAKYLEINFENIKVISLGTANHVKATGYNYNEDDDRNFYTIYFDRDLTVGGEYLLKIPFKAIIANPDVRLSGLYRTTYWGTDGNQKILVVTQFQKAYGREVFPCFDEPSHLFKATFSLKIGRKPNYQSFSNMEKIGQPENIIGHPGWVWDIYEKTVKLPLYTIGFALASDYGAVASPPNTYRLPVKTWVPNVEITNTSIKFTAEASSKLLKFYDELFDFPYPLNKMDNFAAPLELWGMEHMGFVTYRTNFLAFHSTENTQFEKWNSAWLLSHEFVHMWFGNLVTCDWWNDFWLNEGFGRYFQFVGAQISGEDFRATDRFVIDVVQWAMILDEGPQSTPVHGTEMEKVTYSPFQIEYDKAGAIIRMMATFLTQQTFFTALQHYFKKYQYNTTVQDDLFQAMTDQAVADKTLTQFTVKDVMDTWTKLKGFPVIRVSRSDHDTIFLSQHRFVYHPNSENIEAGLWYVPIWYKTKTKPDFNANNTVPEFWMDKNTVITYINVANTDDWIIVNPEARGYYRVIYDDHLTNLIIAQLETDHMAFNFATRSQLFDDYFRSSQARYISINYAMDLTWYLPMEDDLMVWTTVLNNFRPIYTRLIDTTIITPFRKYMLRIIVPPLKRLGTEHHSKDTPSDIMLRAQLLDWSCALEHEICVEYSQQMFNEWISNPEAGNPILPDYQPQVYCSAMASNNKSFPFLMNHYKTARSYRQRNLVIKALACSQNKDYLLQLLHRSIDLNDPEINMRQHGRLLLESLAMSSIARSMAWDFVKEKHHEITKIYGIRILSSILSYIAPYASSKGVSKLDIQITGFIADYIKSNNVSESIEASLQSSAFLIVENSYWMEYYFYDFKDWLMLHVKG